MKKIDLTGRRFGRLTALREAERPRTSAFFWNCICECGKEVIVRGSHLKNGNTRSCGCLRKEVVSKLKTGRIVSESTREKMSRSHTGQVRTPEQIEKQRRSIKGKLIKNLIGQTFGRLAVISYSGASKDKQALWLCRCQCGMLRTVRGKDLTQRKTKSCGCYNRELGKSRTGEKCGAWKGGVYKYNNKSRTSGLYDEWRKAVLLKDNFTCRNCGSKENLRAHHKKSFSDYPEFRFVVENGITYCESCHVDFHKKRKAA